MESALSLCPWLFSNLTNPLLPLAKGSYVIGNLNERPEDVERTIDLAVRLDTNVAQFSILTPYPGAALYEELKNKIFIRRWKFYDALHLVFRHPFINRHLL